MTYTSYRISIIKSYSLRCVHQQCLYYGLVNGVVMQNLEAVSILLTNYKHWRGLLVKLKVNNILLCSGLCTAKARVIAVSLYDPSLSISEIRTWYSPDAKCIVLRHCDTEPASLNRGAGSAAI